MVDAVVFSLLPDWHDDDKQLLRRVRRGEGRQSQGVQVVYASQVLQRRVPKEALADAQSRL